MSAPLASDLLFCLYSFLFGMLFSLLAETLRALFMSVRLLRHDAIEGRISALTVIGSFLYDVITFVSFASLYMIFLFVANEGVFRLSSFALVLCGFFLFRPAARRMNRPLFWILFRLFGLLGGVLSVPARFCARLFRRIARKKRKRLDEKGKMV